MHSFTHSFSYFFSFLSFSLSLFLLKDCSSVSKRRLLSSFFSLSLSLVQFVLAFPHISFCLSYFYREHAKVNKNSNSSPIVTAAAAVFLVRIRHVYKKKEKEERK